MRTNIIVADELSDIETAPAGMIESADVVLLRDLESEDGLALKLYKTRAMDKDEVRDFLADVASLMD